MILKNDYPSQMGSEGNFELSSQKQFDQKSFKIEKFWIFENSYIFTRSIVSFNAKILSNISEYRQFIK